MFRIKNVFENTQTVLFKIEGEINERDIAEWSNWLDSFSRQVEKQIIIEFCHLIIVAQTAVDELFKHMSKDIYLLNSPTDVKNIAHSAGFSKNVLE